MASLERRDNRFRIVFRYDGKKFSRAIKTTSERAALATVARLEDNLRRVELGTLGVPADVDLATFLLSDGQTVATPSAPTLRSLGQLLKEYIASVPYGSIEHTSIGCLRIHQKHLNRVLGKHLAIEALRLPKVQEYINARAKEEGRRGGTVCAVTIKKELTTLSAAWNWALNAEMVNRPFPCRGLKYPKSSEKLIFHTMAEVEKRIASGRLDAAQKAMLWDSVFLLVPELAELLRTVKDAAPGSIYTMMVFAAHTGARRSEIRRCQIDDVDLVEGVVTIHEKKRVRGRLTTRRIPLSPLLSRVLREWMADHPGWGALFYMRLDDRGGPIPMTAKGMAYHFDKALADTRFAELPGWHVFRHSFCSNCAAQGIDQRILDSWVGHQTPEMARRYQHLVPSQHRVAIATMFAASA
jgi:integrase